ncbi:MAG: magnesium transporter [Leptospiraceae bacterium]|nr:magnesium transporter [Leptospiraceae bacterium]
MAEKKKKEIQISEAETKYFLTAESLHEEIENRNIEIATKYIELAHPADIAETIEALKFKDALFLFRLGDLEKQRLIFVELTDEKQSEFVDELTLKEISTIVEQLDSDEVTDLFSELDKEKAEEILNTIDRVDTEMIRTQLNFSEGSAGRLMNTDYATVYMNENAYRAISSVRRAARNTEDIYVIYVMDENDSLKGIIKLKDLILANPKTRIQKMMKPIKAIHYNTDQEEVARYFQKYSVVSAPVVDDSGKMIGRITVDDVLNVVQEEATEDIYRLGGVSEEESLTTSLWSSVKHRLIWLNTNLFIALLTASVVSLFEGTIQRIVILASLMPIVAGMGGNAGTQAITIVVRNISTGELTNYNWFAAVRKEFFIGIINGFSVGLVTFTVTMLFRNDIWISIVIGLAMLINLSIAGLVGSVVPLILKFLKIDPAIASSIFVTACTDMFGFFCFLGLASILIK